MFRKLLCFIGYHVWTWKLNEDGYLSLSGPPPNHATCKHCKVKYKEDETHG